MAGLRRCIVDEPCFEGKPAAALLRCVEFDLDALAFQEFDDRFAGGWVEKIDQAGVEERNPLAAPGSCACAR